MSCYDGISNPESCVQIWIMTYVQARNIENNAKP